MPNWIPGKGFYLVQPTGPINEVVNKKRMDLLESRLQEAEIRLGIREEQSA
ncbi:pilus assembly protein PilO [Psychrobacillus sp. FSL K6-1464]|uniref:pilus assembly protein PilO n=1 Tax=Psychrobacillus sp. FSL K6-1464 TaxID=2921545 RepID=UPI0030FC6984